LSSLSAAGRPSKIRFTLVCVYTRSSSGLALTLQCNTFTARYTFSSRLSLQYAALGQLGLQFEAELHDVTDSAREDIRCYINGQPLEPSEIVPQDCKPTSNDPNGIRSNKEGLSNVRLVSQDAFLYND